MLYLRYRGSAALVLGLLLAASWAAPFEVCVSPGTIVDESCSGHKDEDGDLLGLTPTMLQSSLLESEINVDEERQEVPEVPAQHVRPSSSKVSEVTAPHSQLPNAEATPAPMVPQPQQQMPNKSDGVSFIEALSSSCTAAGARLLRSLKGQIAAELRSFLRRLGVLELELIATKASLTLVFLLLLLAVGLIVLLIVMRAWFKDPVKNPMDHDSLLNPKARLTRESFRADSSMPQPQKGTAMTHMSIVSQPPRHLDPHASGVIVMGPHASPGKPRDLLPGQTPQQLATPQQKPATPQKSATPLLQQTDLSSGRRSVTPAHGQARGAHLCSELVVPDDNECSLLMPKIPETRLSTNGVLSISGDSGLPVLYAAYTRAERPPLGPDDLPGNGNRLVLRSALEDVILASCKDAEPESADGLPRLIILNNREELFGMLRATGPGPGSSYLVSLSTGENISFRRDSKALSSCIVDEDGWLLASSEDAGERGRLICISPRVDAGLMTLIMIGVDILDITMAARGSVDRASPPDHGRTASRKSAPYC